MLRRHQKSHISPGGLQTAEGKIIIDPLNTDQLAVLIKFKEKISSVTVGISADIIQNLQICQLFQAVTVSLLQLISVNRTILRSRAVGIHAPGLLHENAVNHISVLILQLHHPCFAHDAIHSQEMSHIAHSHISGIQSGFRGNLRGAHI